MALGMTTFLMLVVTGVAVLYVREMRISRLGYDEIIAYSNAQGAFEYAMLKIRNHSDGFQDSVSQEDSDGKEFFTLSTPRSAQFETQYTIQSISTNYTFDIPAQSHLILPLFISDAPLLDTWLPSKDPRFGTGTQNTSDLSVSGVRSDQQWIIMAVDSVTQAPLWLAGSGNIRSTSQWMIRHRDSDCYDVNGNQIPCSWQTQEELVYFWDEKKTVRDFLQKVDHPYLMMYNAESTPTQVQIQSRDPFTLPNYSVEARSGYKNTLQIFKFSEDKSKYYDLLKYGVSNIN